VQAALWVTYSSKGVNFDALALTTTHDYMLEVVATSGEAGAVPVSEPGLL
jgi:hypothetical protein